MVCFSDSKKASGTRTQSTKGGTVMGTRWATRGCFVFSFKYLNLYNTLGTVPGTWYSLLHVCCYNLF